MGKTSKKDVDAAITRMAGLGIQNLEAKLDGDVVTLTGHAPDVATKAKAMTAFNTFVETGNTINAITVEEARPASAPTPMSAPAANGPPPTVAASSPQARAQAQIVTQRLHVVAKGETLSGIAKRYYGDANVYMRIFEANKDQLDDPDRIRVGQRLRIP